jgi:hypothetical protein
MNLSDDMNKMGDWGMLYIVCGALDGQTLGGASSAFEGLPSQYEIITNYLMKNKTDEEITFIFSNYIKKWSQDKAGQALAGKRLNQIIKNKAQNVSDKTYAYYKEYLTLAIMLNSLKDIDCYDDLNEVKKWAKNNEYGWQKLFLGVGLLLNVDKDFLWQDYGSCIKSFADSYKKDVDLLFEHFRSER